MKQSWVIELGGKFAGAAVTDNDKFRFVAVDPRLDHLDGSIWPTLEELRRALRMSCTGADCPPRKTACS
jgi:hypothetical protein